jgi:23S rRNA pseudouridine1911/1915/1917 synthase
MPKRTGKREAAPATPSHVARLQVELAEAGERLDRYLAARLPELSRTRIQELIAQGRVELANAGAVAPVVRQLRASHRLEAGDRIEVDVLPRPALRAVAEAIPLELLYEDNDLVAVNKPAGMVVHAGAGQARGTLVNALLHRLGTLSDTGDLARPGIVHRLDRGTSGVLLVARNDPAHHALASQFERRQVEKYYLALLQGSLPQDAGCITLAIARDLRRRTRMTTRRREGRQARTDWRVLLRLDGFTLVEARLYTGRTHQIRVHFADTGHPVVGDTVYGATRTPRAGGRQLPALGRSFLHAARIAFTHPATGARMEIRAPLARELRQYLLALGESLAVPQARIDAALASYL